MNSKLSPLIGTCETDDGSTLSLYIASENDVAGLSISTVDADGFYRQVARVTDTEEVGNLLRAITEWTLRSAQIYR